MHYCRRQRARGGCGSLTESLSPRPSARNQTRARAASVCSLALGPGPGRPIPIPCSSESVSFAQQRLQQLSEEAGFSPMGYNGSLELQQYRISS